MLRATLVLSLATWLGFASTSAAQEELGTFAEPRVSAGWVGGMGLAGVGLGGHVNAWASFDDGGGPAVYAAGWFYAAGEVRARGVARWNGTDWEPVGSGIGLSFAQEVRALAVYDDGSGPALYAAGQFDKIDGKPASGFARWDGTSWEVLPGQVGFGFHALVVGDLGQGPELFAGGEFIRVGGVRANNVARWDGSWKPFGAGIPLRTCRSLAVYDDGGGAALFAGMALTSGESSLRRWDGASWSEVAGTPAMHGNALAVFDDGGGARLAIGGTSAASSAVHAYDGTAFTPLGTLSSVVEDLDVLAGGVSDTLLAGGSLFSTGHVAAWNGSEWLPLGTGTDGAVEALSILDVGSGPRVYVGGQITQAGPQAAHGAASWDGTDWSALGGPQAGLDGGVGGFVEFDDGTGNALYVTGGFERAGLARAHALARWNGASWEEVGGGLHWTLGTVNALVQDAVAYQSGDGPVLVAVGSFTQAGTTPARSIARWNGSSWAPLGPGILAGYGSVRTVETFGPLLYVGGSFSPSAGQPGTRIAAWNGLTQTWSAVGDLTTSVFSSQAGPYDLTVFDDGSGEQLYVAGDIDFADGVLVENLARWNGTSWSAVPFGGLTADLQQTNALVRQCVAIDAPTLGGGALVVRGTFDNAGSVPADGLAWLGASGWSSPPGFARDTIQAVGAVGERLYAIDRLEGVVRWNGVEWVALGGGPLANRPSTSSQAAAGALHRFDDGSGPKLFVGGAFDVAGSFVSTNVARFLLGGGSASPVLRGR